MSATPWVKYQIYCITDSRWEEWTLDADEPEPTTCPVNTAHTVNPDSVVEIDRRSVDEVKILQEDIKTGGYFQAGTVSMVADAEATSQKDITFPIPVSAFTIHFATGREHRGDVLNMYVAPDTIVGGLTADASAGATVLNVQQSVVNHVFLGALCSLFAPPSTVEKVGRVVNVNKNALTITVEHALTQAFAAATPTYVRMSVQMIRDFEIGEPWQYRIGESTFGGSYVRTGTIIRVEYKNQSPPLVVGQITADVGVNDTVIQVNNDVFEQICYGDKVDLYDGSNTDLLGLVTRVDPSNGTINVDGAATMAFAVATPTYVRKVGKKVTGQFEINQ